MKTYNDDLFSDSLIEYVRSGRVVSTKSYVLFHACQDEDDCGDDDLYVVDLNTYLAAVVGYKSKTVENYCRACEEAEEMCVGDDGAAAGDDGVDDGVAAGDDGVDDGAAVGDDGGEKCIQTRILPVWI